MKFDAPQDLPVLDIGAGNIVLFHPHIPAKAINYIQETLNSRWIGQGPNVEKFEDQFRARFAPDASAVAVGSGTDALHLAYILAGLKEGDEVISPVFTCTAMNIPLLYEGVKIRFADIQPGTLNVDPSHVERLMNDRTRAIVCVHYGGLPCDLDELHRIAAKWNVPVIEDAAHALGATYKGRSIGGISEFTVFSFQAIKHITTGDGGMLVLRDRSLTERTKRLRWFGIDRPAKQAGIWVNDISEVGYKYQMTDIAAAMGLAGLEEFSQTLALRRRLFALYEKELAGVEGVFVVGGSLKDREHAAWSCTVLVDRRFDLQKKLRSRGIESNQVHFRNDRYSIFSGDHDPLPNMDSVEQKYLALPLHTKLSEADVLRVCDVIRSGW